MYSQELYKKLVVFVLCLGPFALAGCRMGPNSPGYRQSLDMLRVERDAAEDEYYSLKQKHDEALWKIEDLETQIKNIQGDTSAKGVSYDELETVDDWNRGGFNTSLYADEVSSAKFDSAEEGGDFVDPQPAQNRPVLADGESEVSYVDLDPGLTKGFDSHGKSGDDGIVVAIRPMNASDQFVPVAAPVTISLIDPARSGIRQRVGLWKFSAEQVANRIDYDTKAFLFRLPWQRTSPINSDLKLFVRFQANDGKRESEMDLPVVLDGAPRKETPQKGWTKLEPENDEKESFSNPPPSSFTFRESDPISSDRDVVVEPPNTGGSVQIARPKWSPYR